MNQRKWWGYWIFPNSIPGETPMAELAQTMNELEVDDYYTQQGMTFVKTHWRQMPKLLVGKLIRAYIPIPWTRSMGTIVVSLYRALVGLFSLAGIAALLGMYKRSEFLLLRSPFKTTQTRTRHPSPITHYSLLITALVLTNVSTVLIFWGCARFAFAIEPFFYPFSGLAAVGVVTWFSKHFCKPQGAAKC
jgi:hypothetical protein